MSFSRETENSVYQLAMPELLEGTDKIVVPGKKRSGQPYLRLSHSRLESAAYYLDRPELTVPDPRETVTAEHVDFLRGIAFHKIIQAAELWRSILPAETKDFEQEYYRRLNRISGLIPTAKASEARAIIALLADSRLVMPNLFESQFEEAKKSVYRIITEKVLTKLKLSPPFTDTPSLSGLDEWQSLNDEFPFPQPELVCSAWEEKKQDEMLFKLSERIFQFHEDLLVIPARIYGRHGGYGSEVRYNLIFHHPGIIWSGRFDSVAIGRWHSPDRAIVTIRDYKSGRTRFPQGKYGRAATRSALFMASQAARKLPESFETDGIAIRLTSPGYAGQSERKIIIKYLGFDRFPPSVIDFTEYWGHEWGDYEGSSEQAKKRFDDLVGVIIANENRLGSILL